MHPNSGTRFPPRSRLAPEPGSRSPGPLQAPARPFAQSPGFSLIELLLAVTIMSLTTYLAFSIANPTAGARRDSAKTQLEQLGNAILLYNLNNPTNPFMGGIGPDVTNPRPWWLALGSGFHDPQMADPWGFPFNHDGDRGLVYSFGEDNQDNQASGDDLVHFYRPPTTFVKNRTPAPSSTVMSAAFDLFADWKLRGTLGPTTATISLDGVGIGPVTWTQVGSPSDLYWRVKAPAPPGLVEGTHSIRMMVGGGDDLKGRSAWSFHIDRTPPVVYAVQPPDGSRGDAKFFPVSAFFKDPSGIRFSETAGPPPLAISPVLTIAIANLDPPDALDGWVGTHAGPKAIRDLAKSVTAKGSRVDITGGSIQLTPPTSGWPFGEYTFTLLLQDSIGNPDPILLSLKSWSFTVEDRVAPPLTIQVPEYAADLTTSADIDALTSGVQVQVVGVTEPGATVYWSVWHPDRTVGTELPSPKQTVVANAFGQVSFPITLRSDMAGTPVPQNILEAYVCDGRVPPNCSAGPTNDPNMMTKHLVNLFDPRGAVKIEFAEASPQTTHPNEPVRFSVGATGGTTPYDILWDFEDGYQLTGVMTKPYTTNPACLADSECLNSVNHTYIATGSYSVSVRVKDARGLEDSKLLAVYVGTEDFEPTIEVEALPPEFAYGVPGNDSTRFNVTLGGKFLGAWRLRVDEIGSWKTFANKTLPTVNGMPPDTLGRRWWFAGNDKWVVKGPASNHPESRREDAPPDDPQTLWQLASSNNFSVEWKGQDNTDHGAVAQGCLEDEEVPLNSDGIIDYSGMVQGSCAFNGNKLGDPSNKAHVITLEYRDAFGKTTWTTGPVTLYNSIPRVSSIAVWGVDGDPNSPLLFDANFDNVPDFTKSPRVDLLIPKPTSENPTDLWISNYPIDLHVITTGVQGAPMQLTTYAVEVQANTLVKRGETFHNWTFASGQFYDATDGSSGWIPYTNENPPIYRNWDLEADATPFVAFPGGTQNLPYTYPRPAGSIFPPPPKIIAPVNAPAGTHWSADGNIRGLRLSGPDLDGLREVYAIFRDFGPFLSTQLNDDSQPHTQGVTSTVIILDRTPPLSLAPISIDDVSVTGNLAGQEFVIVDISLNVIDVLSGMVPRGKAVLRIPGRPDQLVPYQNQIAINFGRFSDLATQGTIDLSAQFDFEDNLGNRCFGASCAGTGLTSHWNINLELIQFAFTVVGTGDLRFYQKTDNADPNNVVKNVLEIPFTAIDSNGQDFNGLSGLANYRVLDWRGGIPGGGAIDNSVVIADTNIDPGHFPNPEDRLAVLESVRTEDLGGGIEASQTFVVDNTKWYMVALERSVLSGEVVYRVRTASKATYPTPPLSKITPAALLDNTANGYRAFPIVAEVNKVALPNANPPRLNRGRVTLPREIVNPGDTSNFLPSRRRDLHTSPAGAFDNNEFWDRQLDLLIATNPTDVETYAYRGVIGDLDGGSVGKLAYRVGVNNFSVRANFRDVAVSTDFAYGAWQLIDATLSDPPGAKGPPERIVKVFQVKNPQVQTVLSGVVDDPTLNYGFGSNAGGLHRIHTHLSDIAETPLGVVRPPDEKIGGQKFKVVWADHANAFSPMTTGAVWGAGYVSYDPDGSFSTALPDPILGATGIGIGDGAGAGTQSFWYEFPPIPGPHGMAPSPITSLFPGAGSILPAAHFQNKPLATWRGQPGSATTTLNWPFVFDKEGFLRVIIAYQDQVGNTVGPIQITTYIDAKPPDIIGAEVYMRGNLPALVPPQAPYTFGPTYYLPPATHYDRVDSYWKSDQTTWTSSNRVELYYRVNESSQLAREFVGQDADLGTFGTLVPIDVGSVGFPTIGTPPYVDTVPVTETLQFAGAQQGEHRITVRFQDDFGNVAPPFTPPQDDGIAIEPDFKAVIFRDNVAPVSSMRWTTSSHLFSTYSNAPLNLKIKRLAGDAFYWTNSTAPTFHVTATEPNPMAQSVGFRLGGFHFDRQLWPNNVNAPYQPGNVTHWPTGDNFPPEKRGDAAPISATDFQQAISLSLTLGDPTTVCPGCDDISPFSGTSHGPHFFSVMAYDGLGNPRGDLAPGTSMLSTQVMWDVTGPDIVEANLAAKVQIIPPNAWEEATLTVPAGGGTIAFDFEAPLTAATVVIVPDRVTNVGGALTLLANGGQFRSLGAASGAAFPAAADVITLSDATTWRRSIAIAGSPVADRLELNFTNTSGAARGIRVRVIGTRLAPSNPYAYSRVPIPIPVPLTALGQPTFGDTARGGFHNATRFRFTWNEITAGGADPACVGGAPLAALDPVGAGGVAIGVDCRRHDASDGNVSREWEPRQHVSGAPQSYIPTDLPVFYMDQAAGPSQPTTFSLRARDRLTNRGPTVNVMRSHYDNTNPNRVGNLTVTGAGVVAGGPTYSTSQPYTLQWSGVQDTSGNASGAKLYHLREATSSATPLPWPLVVEKASTATPTVINDTGSVYTHALSMVPFSAGQPLVTGATRGREDDRYWYSVFPMDRATNWNPTVALGQNQVQVLVDTTEPIIDFFGLTNTTAGTFFRNRVAGMANVGTATRWTSDPAILLTYRANDASRFHPSQPTGEGVGAGVVNMGIETSALALSATTAAPGMVRWNDAGVTQLFASPTWGFQDTIQWPAEAATKGMAALAGGPQGLRTITLRPIDRLSIPGAHYTTEFRFDEVGPEINLVGSDFTVVLDTNAISAPFPSKLGGSVLVHLDGVDPPDDPVIAGTLWGADGDTPQIGDFTSKDKTFWVDDGKKQVKTPIPAILNGTRIIKVHGKDAGAKDAPESQTKYSFNLGSQQTLYVAVDADDSANPPTEWLCTGAAPCDGWTNTGQALECDENKICDPNPGARIYSKTFTGPFPQTVNLKGPGNVGNDRGYAVFSTWNSSNLYLPNEVGSAKVEMVRDGGGSPALVAGRFGSGLSFSGDAAAAADEVVRIDDTSTITGAAGSVELWFKPAGDGTIVCKNNDGTLNNQDFRIFKVGSELQIDYNFGSSNSNVDLFAGADGITNGKWYFLVMRWNGTNYQFFLVDGDDFSVYKTRTIGSGSGNLSSNTAKWLIGADSAAATPTYRNRFNGVIDEVRISATPRVYPASYTGTENLSLAGPSLGQVYPTTAIKFQISWPQIDAAGKVTDPGYADVPSWGVGVHQNPAPNLTNEWRYLMGGLPSGFPSNVETSTPAAGGKLPTIEYFATFSLFARDLLGNETPLPLEVVSLVRDLTPPVPPPSIDAESTPTNVPCILWSGAEDTSFGGAQPGLITTYNVFRRPSPNGDSFAGSTWTLVGTTTVASPVSGVDPGNYRFCDPTHATLSPLPTDGTRDDLYEYAVASVDRVGNESVRSNAVRIRFDTRPPRLQNASWSPTFSDRFRHPNIKLGGLHSDTNSPLLVDLPFNLDFTTASASQALTPNNFTRVRSIGIRVFDYSTTKIDRIKIQKVEIWQGVPGTGTLRWSAPGVAAGTPVVLSEPGAGQDWVVFQVMDHATSYPTLTGASSIRITVLDDIDPLVVSSQDASFHVYISAPTGTSNEWDWTRATSIGVTYVATDTPIAPLPLDALDPGAGIAGSVATTSAGAQAAPPPTATFGSGGAGNLTVLMAPPDGLNFINVRALDNAGNLSSFTSPNEQGYIGVLRDTTGPTLLNTLSNTLLLSQAPGRIATQVVESGLVLTNSYRGVFREFSFDPCPGACSGPAIVDEVQIKLTGGNRARFQALRVLEPDAMGRFLDFTHATGTYFETDVESTTFSNTEQETYSFPRPVWVKRIVYKPTGKNNKNGGWRIYESQLFRNGIASSIQPAGEGGVLAATNLREKVEIDVDPPVLADQLKWRQNFDGGGGEKKRIRVVVQGYESDRKVVAADYGPETVLREDRSFGPPPPADVVDLANDVAFWTFEPVLAADISDDFDDVSPIANPGSYAGGTGWAGNWIDSGDGDATTGRIQVAKPASSGAGAADNFESLSFTGGTGWAGPWVEEGESDGPSAGDVQVTGAVVATPALETWSTGNFNGGSGWTSASWTTGGDDPGRTTVQTGSNPCNTGNYVRLQGKNGSNNYTWVERGVDLSVFNQPRLRFKVDITRTSGSDDFYVKVYNGSSWTTLQTYSTDQNCFDQSFDLTAYKNAGAKIRFESRDDTDDDDNMVVDEIAIEESETVDCRDNGHLQVAFNSAARRAIDLSNYVAPELKFDYFVFADDPATDQYVVEVSENGGTTWIPMATYAPDAVPYFYDSFNNGYAAGWVESGDGSGSTGGRILITNSGVPSCNGSSNWLRLEGDGSDNWVEIPLDLTLYQVPVLNFNRDITSWDNGQDTATVDVYNGSSWVNLRTYTNDVSCGSESNIALSSYKVANAKIRFRTLNDVETGDYFWVDRVEVKDVGPGPSCNLSTTLNLASFGGKSLILRFRGQGNEAEDALYVNNLSIVDVAAAKPCVATQHLRVSGPGSVNAERSVDLSSFNAPRLEFDYSGYADDAGDTVVAQYWNGTWNTIGTNLAVSGSDLFEDWTGSYGAGWSEAGSDDNNPSGGRVQVRGSGTPSCMSGNFLQVEGDGSDNWVELTVNLTTFSQPRLSYKYEVNSWDNGNDTARVELWNGSTWVVLATYTNNASCTTLGSPINLNAYTGVAAAKIRFRTQSDVDTGDYFRIDDVRIYESDPNACSSFSQAFPKTATKIRFAASGVEAGDLVVIDDLKIRDVPSSLQSVPFLNYPGLVNSTLVLDHYDDTGDPNECLRTAVAGGMTGAALECTGNNTGSSGTNNDRDFFYASAGTHFNIPTGSVEFWLFPDDITSNRSLMGRDTSGAGTGEFDLGINASVVDLFTETGGSGCSQSSPAGALVVSQWNHVMFRWAKGVRGPELWVNGKKAAPTCSTLTAWEWTAAQDLVVGSSNLDGTATGNALGTANRMNAKLDQIRITKSYLPPPTSQLGSCGILVRNTETMPPSILRSAEWHLGNSDDMDLRAPRAYWFQANGTRNSTLVGADENAWHQVDSDNPDRGHNWVHFVGSDYPAWGLAAPYNYGAFDGKWPRVNSAAGHLAGLFPVVEDGFEWDVQRFSNCSGQTPFEFRMTSHALTTPVVDNGETIVFKLNPPVSTERFFFDAANLSNADGNLTVQIRVHSVDVTRAAANQLFPLLTATPYGTGTWNNRTYTFPQTIRAERIGIKVLDQSGVDSESMQVQQLRLYNAGSPTSDPAGVSNGTQTLLDTDPEKFYLKKDECPSSGGTDVGATASNVCIASDPPPLANELRWQERRSNGITANTIYQITVYGWVASSGFGAFQPIACAPNCHTSLPWTPPPTNTVGVQVRWGALETYASDPGFPNTGIGVSNDIPGSWQTDWVQTDPPTGFTSTSVPGSTNESPKLYMIENSRMEFRLTAKDKLGNLGPPLALFNFGLDAGPPQIISEQVYKRPSTGEVLIGSGGGATLACDLPGPAPDTCFAPDTEREFRIVVSATDLSGMAAPNGGYDYAWSLNGTASPDGTIDVPGNTLDLRLDTTSDGQWILKYQAYDAPGNPTGVRVLTVLRDRTAPTCTGGTGVTENANPTADSLNCNMNDNVDSTVYVRFFKDAAAPVDGLTPDTEFTPGALSPPLTEIPMPKTVTYALGSNDTDLLGFDRFWLRLEDRSGNWAFVGPFRNDVTPPSGITGISAATYQGGPSNTVNVTWTAAAGDGASQAPSGVAGYNVYANTGSASTSAGLLGFVVPASTTLVPGSNNLWYYAVRTRDVALNDDITALVPGTNYTQVLYDTVAPNTLAGNISVDCSGCSNLTASNPATTYINVAQMDAAGTTPHAGEVAGDGSFVLSASFSDGGAAAQKAGFNLSGAAAISVRVYHVASAGTAYDVTRSSNSGATLFQVTGATNNALGDAVSGTWWARFPAPATNNDEATSGIANITYGVVVTLTDRSGNTTTWPTRYLAIDSVLPDVSGVTVSYECSTGTCTSPSATWVNASQTSPDWTLTAAGTPSDTGEVDFDLTLGGGSWITDSSSAGGWSVNASNATIGGLETTTLGVNVRVRDKAGNQSVSQPGATNISFDNVLPIISVTAHEAPDLNTHCNASCKAGGMDYTFTVNDGSGPPQSGAGNQYVRVYQGATNYLLNGASGVTISPSVGAYGAGIVRTIASGDWATDPNGSVTYTIEVAIRDAAGNLGTGTRTGVKLDFVVPTLSITAHETTGGTWAILGDKTDGSGLAFTVDVTEANTTGFPTAEADQWIELYGTTSTTHRLDTAGNNRVSPVTALTAGGSGQTVTIATASFSSDPNGSEDYTIRYRLTDGAGNVSAIASKTNCKIDFVLPVVNVTAYENSGGSGWANISDKTDGSGLDVSFNVSDANPGAYPTGSANQWFDVYRTGPTNYVVSGAFDSNVTAAGSFTRAIASGAWSPNPNEISDATIEVNIKDAAGNVGTGTLTNARLDFVGPTLNNFSIVGQTSPYTMCPAAAQSLRLDVSSGSNVTSTLQVDDPGAGGFVTAASVGTNPRGPEAAGNFNPAWNMGAGFFSTNGVYLFRAQVVDTHGNSLTTGNLQITATNPSGSITLDDWENGGGSPGGIWVNRNEVGSANNWRISGTYSASATPSIYVEIRKGGAALASWNVGYLIITTNVANKINASSVTGGNWWVDIDDAVLGTLEASDVEIHIRMDVCGTSGVDTASNTTVRVDMVNPTTTCNWESVASGLGAGWANAAELSDGSGWRIDGTASDGNGVSLVEVRINQGTDTAYKTASGTGSWTYDYPAGNFSAVNNITNATLDCRATDTGGNQFVQSVTNVKIDGVAPVLGNLRYDEEDNQAADECNNCTNGSVFVGAGDKSPKGKWVHFSIGENGLADTEMNGYYYTFNKGSAPADPTDTTNDGNAGSVGTCANPGGTWRGVCFNRAQDAPLSAANGDIVHIKWKGYDNAGNPSAVKSMGYDGITN